MNQDRMQFKAIDRDTKEVTEITGFTVNKKKIIKIMWGDGYFDAYANVDIIQSIGKRDKNNVLIFDGDIVLYSYNGESEIGVIGFKDCAYQVFSVHEYKYYAEKYQSKHYVSVIDDLEVIGHKLTHPELVQKMHELKK